MIVGVPKETKEHEYRAGMLPVGVEELVRAGHRVLAQKSLGLGSGIHDADYERSGAVLVDDPDEIWDSADLVVKVKEPQPREIGLLRPGQLVFTYFHFAASEALTKGVLASGATAIAYETLQDRKGNLCLLTPMSEVAGRMSIQQGAKYLERPQEGRGILLGGVPGVEPAHITVLGGGVVGTNAAKIAAGFGASVCVLDTSLERLRYLDDIMPHNVTTLFSDRHVVLDQLAKADLVVGAVLLRGARTPRLVTRADLGVMKQGAVVVDVSVDQGGCFETIRPTTHADPTYVVDGVVHYAVANMPGAVGRTSTYALANATLPYAVALAHLGLERAVTDHPEIASAVNIHDGRVTHPAVAETFGLACAPLRQVTGGNR
ncbi:MAG: alanine dehydrogenase [Polyangiaceae bacterium]|nr:alanine dehydrogenase [Polyangiaceae bacterium]